VVISLAILLPHSSYTHLWHVASEEFNGPNTTSPVWIAYQQQGGDPSAAMSFSFRLQFWFLLIGNIVVVALWQAVILSFPSPCNVVCLELLEEESDERARGGKLLLQFHVVEIDLSSSRFVVFGLTLNEM